MSFRRSPRPAFKLSYSRKRSTLGPKSPPVPGMVYAAAASFMLMCSPPTVEASRSVEVQVPAASMELQTAAPLVGSGAYVEALAANFALHAGTPTVAAARMVDAPAASFHLGTSPPAVVGQLLGIVAAPAAGFTLTVAPPFVAATPQNSVNLPIPAVSFALVAVAPAVQFTAASPNIAAPGAAFTLQAGTPTVAVSSVALVAAPAASFALTTTAPVARVTAAIQAPSLSLQLQTPAPSAFVTVSRTVPAASFALAVAAPEFFALPAPEAGSYLGWDANGKIVNLTPQAILDQIASTTGLAGWWIDTGA